MSDIGDDFKALREIKREKKAANKSTSTSVLDARGIVYTAHNGGTHLVITDRRGVTDFWPSTGLYVRRWNQSRGRGLRNLLNELVLDAEAPK